MININIDDVRKKDFIFKGDKYVGFYRRWKDCPRISGVPQLKAEKYREYYTGSHTQHYVVNEVIDIRVPKHRRLGRYGGSESQNIIKKRDRTRSVPDYDYITAPAECLITRLITYPFERFGGYQCAITGTYGSGKSNLMNCLLAQHLAQDVSILMFNDRRFEARSLCDKGYFDNSGEFHPFQVDVLVPENYKFQDQSNPLWDHRNNVSRIDWSESQDIIDTLGFHKLTVVYTECFDQASVLRLWIDLMQTLAEQVSPEKTYIFAHHEFSTLIPETPTREIAKTVREASDVAMNLRKDKIGLMTTFHMLSEVYYRLSQKFTYIIYRRPTIRKSMTKAEEDARGFGKTKLNVVSGGRWMTHWVGMYPEITDKYRLIPQRVKLNYPSMQISEDKDMEDAYSEIFNDPINIKIMQMRAKGASYREIATELSLSVSTIYNRAKKLGID